MKIVVLDGYTLNPGDLSWEKLESLGDCEIYDTTVPEQVVERSIDADIVIVNKVRLPKSIIEKLPNLKYIGILATGYDVVDTAFAKTKGIPVCNIPSYGTASVAQTTFALILELCHHVQEHNDAVKRGDWTRSPNFCFWQRPLIELAGKTLGIVGFGRVGQNVADIGNAFGMKIVAHDRIESDQSHRCNFKWLKFEELLNESDIVSLHCPLFPETKGIIDSAAIGRMKKTAFLVNTSRGPLIVDDDLAAALNADQIAGAALDVLSVEPPPSSNPLLSAKNCLITPHISWATKEARTRLMDIAVDNVRTWLAGGVTNRVNL